MTWRIKLMLSHTLLILILVPLLGIYLLSTQHRSDPERWTIALRDQGTLLAEVLRADPTLANDSGRLQLMLERLRNQTATRIQLLDRAGHSVASTHPADLAQPRLVRNAPTSRATESTGAAVSFTVPVPVDSRGQIAAIRLSAPTANESPAFDPLIDWLKVSLPTLVLLALFTGNFLGLVLARPLQQLDCNIQMLGAGKFPPPIKVSSRDEVGTLAKHFNRLVDDLATRRDAHEQLLDDLAHELRRPLGALQAATEVLREHHALDPEITTRLITGIHSEISRLGRLVNRLSDATRDEPAPLALHRATFDLARVAARVVSVFTNQAQQYGVTLTSELPSAPLPLDADEDALIQVLTNLVDNAIRYTPRGGSVYVSAGTNQFLAWLQVADTGLGLTSEEQARIFTRRYRGEYARQQTQGMGLGLAITAELVRAHHGTIRVHSAPNQGACFRVELPR